MYIFNGAYSIFYLMHHKIQMNIIKRGVRIKGIRISEDLLYLCICKDMKVLKMTQGMLMPS